MWEKRGKIEGSLLSKTERALKDLGLSRLRRTLELGNFLL